MDDSTDRFQLVELFMAKCGNDWNRCFHGTIRRETDADGKPVVIGKIKVNDAYIIASASDQWKLGDKLDQIVLLVLDYGLHSDAGRSYDIAGCQYFLS